MYKECYRCHLIKPLSDFFTHPQMADGHLNKCKDCSNLDSQQNRRKNISYYREYDRLRSQLPHRQQKRMEILKQQKLEQPDKYYARTKANNALRDGYLKKEPCYFCGSEDNVEMHHPDYTKPLRVYWLCRICHRKIDGMLKIGVTENSSFETVDL